MATATPFPPEGLRNRAVIALVGDGILGFLNNILTCGLENLNQGAVGYGALLSPQGKILHDVFIHNHGAEVLVDCDASQRDALVAKLKLYRLRVKFEIVPRDDVMVMVGGDGPADPRADALGARRIGPRSGEGEAPAYDDRRYRLGIADSAEIGSGKLFPHEANFDQLGAVDFKKGCYIGQEVVSRMQHRATARSRILPVELMDQPTDEIRAGDVLVGEVLGRRARHGLALIRLDRLADMPAALPVKIHKPAWAQFEVPGT